MKLFTTGFIQVALVAINTWQIANHKWAGAFVVGFLISFVWTFNVKKIAFGGNKDRVVYSFGAATGTVTGMALAYFFYR